MLKLLMRDIRIERILESERNQDNAHDKYNRVDMLAEDTNKFRNDSIFFVRHYFGQPVDREPFMIFVLISFTAALTLSGI